MRKAARAESKGAGGTGRMLCEDCRLGEMRTIIGPYDFRFRDTVHRLDDVEFLKCDRCGAITLTREQAIEMQRRAASAARAGQGLLTGEEIRELRRKLGGVTQHQLEAMLGVGAKTVVRWERGTVLQSRTADTLMRLLRVLADDNALAGRLEERVVHDERLRDFLRSLRGASERLDPS